MMETKCNQCEKPASQRLIMKTVLIVDVGRSPGFVAGDTWNSTGSIFLCNECSTELFQNINDHE